MSIDWKKRKTEPLTVKEVDLTQCVCEHTWSAHYAGYKGTLLHCMVSTCPCDEFTSDVVYKK